MCDVISNRVTVCDTSMNVQTSSKHHQHLQAYAHAQQVVAKTLLVAALQEHKMFCPVENVRTEAQTCRTFMRANTKADVFFILVF